MASVCLVTDTDSPGCRISMRSPTQRHARPLVPTQPQPLGLTRQDGLVHSQCGGLDLDEAEVSRHFVSHYAGNMVWLRVVLSPSPQESQEDSKEPRLGLGVRGPSCDPSRRPLPPTTWAAASQSAQQGFSQVALEGCDRHPIDINNWEDGGTERDRTPWRYVKAGGGPSIPATSTMSPGTMSRARILCTPLRSERTTLPMSGSYSFKASIALSALRSCRTDGQVGCP